MSARDWPEDAAHENGSYNCACLLCEAPFVGHKRRVICKKCAQPRGLGGLWLKIKKAYYHAFKS